MLDPAAQGRDAELRRAFAEFMIHQVALVRGVVDGARALLARLSPDAILLSATWSAWPVRAAKLWKWIPLWKPLWKEFERRFHDLADEENSISKVLFGKEFARAYTSMAGQAPGDDEADADVTLRSAR
jgi:predicted component of type VI protein secretion system